MLIQAIKSIYNTTIKYLKVKHVVNKSYKVHKKLYLKSATKMQRSYKNWVLNYKSLRIKTMNKPMYNTKKADPKYAYCTSTLHITTFTLLGFEILYLFT